MAKAKKTGPADTNHDFYHKVLDSIEDYAVFTTDTKGIVTSWNTGAENLLGYKEDEILNANAAVIFTKADVEKGEHIKELQNALKKGSSVNERFHVRKSGSKFWGSGKVFPLYNSDKKHIGFTKIMRNLAERRQAQEQLLFARNYAETIIESAIEPIIVLNDDLTVNTANKSFYNLFKIRKIKPLTPFEHLFKDESNSAEFIGLLNEFKNRRELLQDVEISHDFKLVGKRILLVNGRKLYPGTNLSLIMLSIQDITGQRTLEQQKDDFISIASHEIRTPLTVIKATAQILLRQFGNENNELARSASKINEKTDKLLTLIRYLLDASQITKNEFVVKPENFVMTDLVAESVEELLLINPELSIIIKGKVKDIVYADRFRISQVINNLLNNAVKYSPPDKDIIVRVTKSKNGNKVMVSVQDFGIGISKEEQKNLFKRFWRAPTVKRNIPGIGLGLYISSQIIKMHEGKIWLISDKNKGSTFKFSIPIKAV
jgi:PAS domain S-box-containing protein